MKKKDKCRIENADICMRCNQMNLVGVKGIGWYICAKCAKELMELRKHFEKYGLYGCLDNRPTKAYPRITDKTLDKLVDKIRRS
jgi:hypothetical protein